MHLIKQDEEEAVAWFKWLMCAGQVKFISTHHSALIVYIHQIFYYCNLVFISIF